MYLGFDHLQSELYNYGLFSLPFIVFSFSPSSSCYEWTIFLQHKSDYYFVLWQGFWNSLGIAKINYYKMSSFMSPFLALTSQCTSTTNFLSSPKCILQSSVPYFSYCSLSLRTLSYLLYLVGSYSSLKAKFRRSCFWETFLGRGINYLLFYCSTS